MCLQVSEHGTEERELVSELNNTNLSTQNTSRETELGKERSRRERWRDLRDRRRERDGEREVKERERQSWGKRGQGEREGELEGTRD